MPVPPLVAPDAAPQFAPLAGFTSDAFFNRLRQLRISTIKKMKSNKVVQLVVYCSSHLFVVR